MTFGELIVLAAWALHNDTEADRLKDIIEVAEFLTTWRNFTETRLEDITLDTVPFTDIE